MNFKLNLQYVHVYAQDTLKGEGQGETELAKQYSMQMNKANKSVNFKLNLQRVK